MATLGVTLLLSLGIVALAFAGIGIRILLVKNGEFRGTCSSNNPLLNKEGVNCPVCGKEPGEPCENEEQGKTLPNPSRGSNPAHS